MLSLFRQAPPRVFKRVIYADDPALVLGKRLAEHAYGAQLVILPAGAAPPECARDVRGTVMHLDAVPDARWVRGQVNPMLEWLAVKSRVGDFVNGVVDVDDRWDEHRFLEQVAPELAPPRTALASRFAVEELSAEEEAAARPAAERVTAREGPVRQKLVRLEALRRRMHAALGASVIKGRELFTSEGRLPATTEDWAALYVAWARRARSRVEEIRLEVEGTSATLESRIKDLPHVKGRVLETLVADPERVVVQALVPVAKEVRVHVVEGRILEGATFLRFYPLGQHLDAGEVAQVHRQLTEQLLARLPPELARFSCAADVIVKPDGGLAIIDLNSGLESGYFFPEEDLFTTNLLASHYAGRRTGLLAEFDAVMAREPGAARSAGVAGLRRRFAPILVGDVQEAFWDRVLERLIGEVRAQGDAAALSGALEEVLAAGLTQASVAHQLISWAHAVCPAIKMGRAEMAGWVGRLSELDPRVRTLVSDGRLEAVPAVAPARPRRERVAFSLVPVPARF